LHGYAVTRQIGKWYCTITGLIHNILIANFNSENPEIGTPKSRDFGIGKRAGIPGFRDPGNVTSFWRSY